MLTDKRHQIGRRLTHRYRRDPYIIRNVLRLPVPYGIPPVGGYTAWYSCAVPDSIIAFAGRLKVWMDLSGSGFHAGPMFITSGGQTPGPLFGSRTMNGMLVPDFQAATQYGMMSDAPRDDRSSSTFAVIETDTVAAGLRHIVGSDGTGGIQMRLSANDLQAVTSAALLGEQLNTISASTPVVVGQVVAATTIDHYSNTTTEQDSNSTALTSGRKMTIGQDQVNGQPWDGAIAEILYYGSTLSGADALLVVNWLKARWGIA